MCVRTSTAFYGRFILSMGRSPGFGSMYTDCRTVHTRFPFGLSHLMVLNLACIHNSPDRSTKSTRLHSYGAFAACRHMVSGSLSLPSRGPFHLSLTVLYAIGHQVVFSLMRWSSHVHTGLHVSCATLDTRHLKSFSPTRLLLCVA